MISYDKLKGQNVQELCFVHVHTAELMFTGISGVRWLISRLPRDHAGGGAAATIRQQLKSKVEGEAEGRMEVP